jgi:DNA-binding NarL/FixJ family response regulator
MRIFIVDPHLIYRNGLASCLRGLSDAEAVDAVGDADEAWSSPALAAADVVVVDLGVTDVHGFVRRLRSATSAQVLVCAPRNDDREVLAAVEAGAAGFLSKDTLTPDGLATAVRAAAAGAGVLAPDVLGRLLRTISRASREVLEPRGLSLSRLSAREVQVLRLVAQGLPTREVATQLSYSERTIKNVIHDVTTKMNARTRSQAVAAAVREGLI